MEPGQKDCLEKGVSDVLQLNFLKLLTNDSTGLAIYGGPNFKVSQPLDCDRSSESIHIVL